MDSRDLQKSSVMYATAKPFVRWWWFADEIHLKTIRTQLHWAHSQGFGGVEIAWVYPTISDNSKNRTVVIYEQDWQELIHQTLEICKELGLGCDLTYTSLWPFCGSFIPPRYAARYIEGSSKQVVDRSWESAYRHTPVPILDHFDEHAVDFYMDYLRSHGFEAFAKQYPGIAFFCDSLEVEMEDIGYEGIVEDFQQSFGLDIRDYRRTLDDHPDIRYSYRKLIAEKYLNVFFKHYVEACHDMGALARVQCHGALVDLLDAYAMVDIPESESILFYPDFSLIPASAAAISGKNIVSSETFTCMYGWVPRPQKAPGLKQESILDLLCLADAQFAFGINEVVYHGMPFWNKEFYAGVHIGPEGILAQYLKGFNKYLEHISTYMRIGKAYTRLAVYLPLEDQWMNGNVPDEVRTISNRDYWEMQEVKMPVELNAFRPLYCSRSQIQAAQVNHNGSLTFKQTGTETLTVEALYCYSEYMDKETLQVFHDKKKLGANIIFRQAPKPAGLINPKDLKTFRSQVKKIPIKAIPEALALLLSPIPLDYWIRHDLESGIYHIFIAHPENRNLRYPLKKDFSKQIKATSITVTFHDQFSKDYPLQLEFGNHGSIIVTICSQSNKVTMIQTQELFDSYQETT